MQVRGEGVPAVAQPCEALPGDDLVADSDGDAPGLEVRVDGPQLGPDQHDHVVAGRLARTDARRQRVGWLIRQIVANRDNRAVRCSDDTGAVAEPLLGA